MVIREEIEHLQRQIAQHQQFLEKFKDNKLMALNIKSTIDSLKEKLESLPKETSEPTVQLLFSGNAVIGSKGIKTDFLSKVLQPFQQLFKVMSAMYFENNKIGERGKVKKFFNTDLYLEALPQGSFGIKLNVLEKEKIFDELEASEVLKNIVRFIEKCTKNRDEFDEILDEYPIRSIKSLKSLLKEISDADSILKLDSNEVGVSVSSDEIKLAYDNVANIELEESELIEEGIFKGVLLVTGRFEAEIDGKPIKGYTSSELAVDKLTEYNKNYTDEECKIHLKVITKIFKSKDSKTEYELLEIESI